jgi:MYXO-CTERM domain-containing protein
MPAAGTAAVTPGAEAVGPGCGCRTRPDASRSSAGLALAFFLLGFVRRRDTSKG